MEAEQNRIRPPHNPYRDRDADMGVPRASDNPYADLYDERADGFTGEKLDQLVRGAFTDGVQEERRRLITIHQQERTMGQANAYDEGYRDGHAASERAIERRSRDLERIVSDRGEAIREAALRAWGFKSTPLAGKAELVKIAETLMRLYEELGMTEAVDLGDIVKELDPRP